MISAKPSQANVSGKVDQESGKVDGPSSNHIRQIAYNCWRDPRHDHIEGGGQIHQRDCDSQVQGYGMGSRIVYEATQRGEHGSKSN